MNTEYNIAFEMSDSPKSLIERGFLKLTVTQIKHPFNSRTFIYCLHCLKLGSQSWFNYHKKDFTFDLSRETVAKHHIRFSRYIEDVKSEVELLNESRKLFREKPQRILQPRTNPYDYDEIDCLLEQEQRPLELCSFSSTDFFLKISNHKKMKGTRKMILSKERSTLCVSVLKRPVLSTVGLTVPSLWAFLKCYSNGVFYRNLSTTSRWRCSKASLYRS